MDASEVIETLPLAAWLGPFEPALQTRAVAALEAGRVLAAPLPFRLLPEEADLLSPAIMGSERKNISFDPARGSLGNTALDGAQAERLRGMLRRFGDGAEALLHDLLPGYANSLQRARTSFRPAEIAGRAYSPRHDDRLLHVDAFPSRPMHGQRILRLFSNIAADGATRAWRVGEPFPDFARQFLPYTGKPLPGSAWLLQQLGLTKGRRSAYDHIMLRLHDAGKLDRRYQAARRCRLRRRHHLAMLHRSGAACGAGRALRVGADLPSAGHRHGAPRTRTLARSRAADRARTHIISRTHII
jgi:hypothetical protein